WRGTPARRPARAGAVYAASTLRQTRALRALLRSTGGISFKRVAFKDSSARARTRGRPLGNGAVASSIVLGEDARAAVNAFDVIKTSPHGREPCVQRPLGLRRRDVDMDSAPSRCDRSH